MLKTHFPGIRLIVFSCLCFNSVAHANIQSTDTLTFSTSGQPLSLATQSSHNFIPLYDKTTLRKTGEIKKVDLEGVPLSQLQAAWESGVQQCDDSSYGSTVKIAGIVVARPVSPSRTQCLNGATITYPKGVKTCYTGLGIPYACVDYKSVTISGAPPYPTSTSSDIYDAGAIFDLSSQTILGFQLIHAKNAGTVDVDFATRVQINIDPESHGEFIITATEITQLAHSKIASDYNDSESFSIVLEGTIGTRAALTTCMPPDPCSTSTESQIYNLNEQLFFYEIDDTNSGVQGIISDYRIEFLSENIVNAIDPPAGNPIVFEFGAQNLIDLGLLPDALEFQLGLPLPLLPGTSPIKGLPKFGVSLPFADVGIYSPDFDLDDDYSCAPEWDIGSPASSGCIDRFFIDDDDVLHRTQEPAPNARNALQSGLIDKIVLDSDLYRFDLDIDFLLSGGVGLGVQVGVPLTASVALDLGDIDLATFWGRAQDLSFEPGLQITLNFSLPTLVKVNGSFELKNTHSFSPGQQVILKSPSPSMMMTPVYALAENKFTNKTDAYVDFAIEEKLLAFESSGALLELIGNLVNDDLTISVAALQASIGLGDVRTASLINDTYTLQGFSSIAGKPISIGGSLDSDGDGLSDADEATYNTNPLHADTDGDYVGDYEEIKLTLTDPNTADIFADLLVTERDSDAIVQIDLVGPNAGKRNLVSGNGRGSGSALNNPVGLTVQPDGQLLVVNVSSGQLLRVDPVSGDRTLVSSNNASAGSGTALHQPTDVLLESARYALVADQGSVDRIFRIDLTSGERSVVAEPTGNSAPVFIALETNGNILVAGQTDDKIRRFKFSENGMASEIPVDIPISGVTGLTGVAVQPDGKIAVTASHSVRLHEANGALINQVSLPHTNNRGIIAPYRGGAIVSSWDNSGDNDAILVASFAGNHHQIVSAGSTSPKLGFPEGLALRALLDSDADGMGDTDEIRRGLNPSQKDSDGDGLFDGAEFSTHLTDPAVKDSDADGFEDGLEVNAGSDPNDADSKPDIEQIPLLGNAFYLLLSIILSWLGMAALHRR